MKFSYLLFCFFLIFQCGTPGPVFEKIIIWIQGNSTNIKIVYEDNKQEIFSTSKEKKTLNIEKIKSGFHIGDIGIVAPYGAVAEPLASESVYFDFSSEKKTDFTVSFLLSSRSETTNEKQAGNTPLTFFFTNQNITFDKGKLILDGIETEVSDYKYTSTSQ